MLELLEMGGTVNANRFCDTLRKLKTPIKNHMMSKGVILLQDNARPFVVKVCKDLLHHFRWELLYLRTVPTCRPAISMCSGH